MNVEEKVTKKGLFILSPQKKKNHKHLDFLLKKKKNKTERALSVRCSFRSLFIIYLL